ncbi:NfeD family protein [Croceicoccus sp. F390]|uniref:NfeD family protein n=1 Tax=Croceicoccus esteveae TaxID=3075597 RepID=A0ABU2ZJK6_9SPHN|nr:NfeD family protein [Croceicoccus sp. F390]MDT0576787.1 NfeD family protein [Croceicoccus sp. F390]
MDWLDGLGGQWAWLLAGVLLATAELVVPGYFLIWMAAAAFVTAFVTGVAGVGIEIQVLCFAVFSIFAVAAARQWLSAYPIASSDPLMNDKGGRLVGQSVTVTQAIEHGSGRARLGDSEWPVRGADAPVGTRLVVTGHEGLVLVVDRPVATHIGSETKIMP